MKKKNVTKLSIPDAVAMLNESPFGLVITAKRLEADIAGGAPKNKDGSLNLLHYCEWLLTQSKTQEG